MESLSSVRPLPEAGTVPTRLPQPAAVSTAVSDRPRGPGLPERRVGRCSAEEVELLHQPPSGLSRAEGVRPTPFPGGMQSF